MSAMIEGQDFKFKIMLKALIIENLMVIGLHLQKQMDQLLPLAFHTILREGFYSRMWPNLKGLRQARSFKQTQLCFKEFSREK